MSSRAAIVCLILMWALQRATAAEQFRFYDWSGVYVGANAGYGTVTGITSDQSFAGVILGGQVGANLQYRNVVFGIEVDGDWSNQKGTSPTFSLNVPWITTARMRIGAASDRIQYYLTGGVGYLRLNGTDLTGTAFNSTPRVWIAGVGQESAVNQNILLRFEFLYMQPLSNTVTLPDVTSGVPTDVRMHELMGRVGLSYKFAFPGI